MAISLPVMIRSSILLGFRLSNYIGLNMINGNGSKGVYAGIRVEQSILPGSEMRVLLELFACDHKIAE